jgi:hypothetical protein
LGMRATIKSAKKIPQKYGRLVTPTTLSIYRMPVFLCFIGSAEYIAEVNKKPKIKNIGK